jgi:hypothetical protein
MSAFMKVGEGYLVYNFRIGEFQLWFKVFEFESDKEGYNELKMGWNVGVRSARDVAPSAPRRLRALGPHRLSSVRRHGMNHASVNVAGPTASRPRARTRALLTAGVRRAHAIAIAMRRAQRTGAKLAKPPSVHERQ